MSVRQFKLINDSGQEFDLMRTDAFFHAPDGLGFDIGFDVVEIGDSYLAAHERIEQKQVSGEIVFAGYSQYSEFMAFISGSDMLRLAYKPQSTWYYLDCRIASLGKTEISTSQVLICPITFLAFSTWYASVVAQQAETPTDVGKVYSYIYPYVYIDSELAEVRLNGILVASPLKIHIFGACTNPSWALSQGGEVIARGAVSVSISADQKLVVDANPSSMEIALYTSGNAYVADEYQASDFSTARFIYAPVGDSTLTITAESGDIQAVVEVYKRELSV